MLEFVMRYLDAGGRWLGTPVLETSAAVLQQACEQEHQRYLLFSSLLRHVVAAEQLTPAERGAVLRLAVHESRQLEAALAAPALLLALRELPAVIASHGGPGQQVPPMPPPSTPPRAAPLGAAPDGGAPAAQQELELVAVAAGTAAPASLQPQVLAAVEQLARRVEDSGQLLEAVASTVAKLRGAAPISTAALQCCVAAGQAVAFAAPKVRACRGWAAGLQVQAALARALPAAKGVHGSRPEHCLPLTWPSPPAAWPLTRRRPRGAAAHRAPSPPCCSTSWPASL